MAISDNTNKINELIAKINALPVAGSGGTDGVSPTISIEEIDGGHIILITDINGTQSFFVANGQDGEPGATGEKGDPGENGIGISSIKQTTTSTDDGGTNVITATLSNGQTSTFNIKNGTKGSTGATGATGANGIDGVGIASIKQTTTSTANGGTNVITATLTNGETSTFNIKNGARGSAGATGATGVGVSSVMQTTTSSADGGTNVVTVTLSDGSTYTFNVKNGSKGSTGADGAAGSNATINGVNTLTLNTGAGLTKTQSGSTMTISANYEYGQTDLTAGSSSLETGKLYFVYE